MIIIKISGGLGNQLFQYAFGRSIAKKLDTTFEFDLELNQNVAGFTPRSFGLAKFNLEAKLADKELVRSFKVFNSGIAGKIERKLVQQFPVLNRDLVIERTFTLIENNRWRDNCYYDGYWQSEKYFKSNEDLIRKELQLELKLNNEKEANLQRINSTEAVSLHIRRGDYLSFKGNASLFSQCSMEYYKEAIEFFKQRLANPVFYVFSDDVDWARENFQGGSFHIINSDSNDPHTDLMLMSKCHHHIIANSSFSWWGAWLNGRKDKVVISPKSWYRNPDLDKAALASVLPDSWIRI